MSDFAGRYFALRRDAEALRGELWRLMELIDYDRGACCPAALVSDLVGPGDLAEVRSLLARTLSWTEPDFGHARVAFHGKPLYTPDFDFFDEEALVMLLIAAGRSAEAGGP